MSTQNSNLIKDIEILRAIAVLAVFFQHLPNLLPRTVINQDLLSVMSGGWAGVDLFFAISGFVITRSFFSKGFNEAKTRLRQRVFSFWAGRIFRLLPSAWLWLLILLLASAYFNDSGIFGPVRTNLIWTTGGMLNFSNFLMVSYFGVEKPGASFVYWSLSLEEQFYIVFPFLAILLRKNIAWLSMIVIILLVGEMRSVAGMMFRIDAIAYGIIIAIFQMSDRFPRVNGNFPRQVVLLAVIGLLCALFFVAGHSQTEFPYQVSIIALISALIIIPSSENKNVLANFGPVSTLFLWIGQRSYAIYLIHIPTIFAIRELAFRFDWPLTSHPATSAAITLALVLALSELNYRFLETPFRTRGRKLSTSILTKAQ